MAKKRGTARTERPSETWQVGAARLPLWILRSEGGEVCQAWMGVCVRQGSEGFLVSEPGPEETIPELLENVVSAALQRWRARPRRVQGTDPSWGPAPESVLAPRGVAVEAAADLPLLREVLETLPRRIAEHDPRPDALSGDGITPDHLAALARAAAGFMTASGWRHLNEDDLVRIDAPHADTGQCFFTLSHAGERSAPDLVFFPDAEAFAELYAEDDRDDFDDLDDFEIDEDDFLEPGDDFEFEADWDGGEEGTWRVAFLPPWAAPAADVELWQAHGLPWAGESLLPVATFTKECEVQRPDRRQIAFFEGLFAALAATTEEDLDSGHWEKQVSTAEGEARFVLSLPEVLEPSREPSSEPFAVLRVLERSMRRMKAAPAEETSPQDHAEDLLERAYLARGRRGVLIARQALEVWPDCADAYSFLAGRAPNLESAARLYETGMAAGERAMGAGAFEQAGHFWGILETRPYMRARAGLAKVLVEQERLAEAVEHYREMLRLNPNDNQGLRHTLVNLLIELDRDEETRKLVESYPEDGTLLEFPRALLLFRRDGDSLEARRALNQAVRSNRFVPGMLLGDRVPPPRDDSYSPSGEDEAGLYLVLARDTW